MERITDNLADYLNMMNYIMIAVETKTISDCDVAYSDMKGEVIKSFPQRVAEQIQLQRKALEEAGYKLIDDITPDPDELIGD